MSTAAVEEAPVTEENKAREVLFFELEFIATTGRQALFDSVKQALKSKDIEVTPALFARCGITSRPGPAIHAIIEDSGKNITTGDQVAAQAETAMQKFFAAKATLNKDLPALIKAAREKDMDIVAISAWPEKTAQALMEKLGLDKLDVDLEAFDSEDPVFPRADHWLRLLKQRDQETIPLIAIVSSRAACKGAMTAGATCIAVPDAHTAFEDFAGAKQVLESLGEISAEEMLDLVSRR